MVYTESTQKHLYRDAKEPTSPCQKPESPPKGVHNTAKKEHAEKARVLLIKEWDQVVFDILASSEFTCEGPVGYPASRDLSTTS